MTDLQLNQLITVTFDVTDPERHITIVIKDVAETDADSAAAAYDAGEFDIDDLFGSLWAHAEVTYTENGVTEHLTGAQFNGGQVLVDLDGVEPSSITFADIPEPVAG